MNIKRKLGRSGIEVSALGMGCWAIGGPFWDGETPLGWGQVDDQESIKAIHKALDLGITFFDTADVYGAGHSERVLAQALSGRRHEVVIATKFANIFDEESRQVTGSSAKPEYIRQACEASLRRLDTDVIDLYQFHDNAFPPEDADRVRETLEELVEEGKIRSYGWSTDFADRAEIFAQGKHCTAIQLQLNVLSDNPDVLTVCEKKDLAAINRGPLAMGLLTGKYDQDTQVAQDDVRGRKSPEWMAFFKQGKPNPEWLKQREAVVEILTSDGRTLAQGALAWLWARSPKTVPIPGFRTIAQVEENCAAMQFGALSDDSMQEIEEILRPQYKIHKMNNQITDVHQLLQRFQDGYTARDITKLDEFMELFLPSDEIELIGIGAVARNQHEWFQGIERIREIVESDWQYWGDVILDVEAAKITVEGNVAWLSTTGAILQTDHIHGDDVTNFNLQQMKEILENEEMSLSTRMMEVTHFGMRRLREREKKVGYRWSFTFTAVLVQREGRWYFHTIHWSMPVD